MQSPPGRVQRSSLIRLNRLLYGSSKEKKINEKVDVDEKEIEKNMSSSSMNSLHSELAMDEGDRRSPDSDFTESSPPGYHHDHDDLTRDYIAILKKSDPVVHPKCFHEKNLPPGIPLTNRTRNAIMKWAKDAGRSRDLELNEIERYDDILSGGGLYVDNLVNNDDNVEEEAPELLHDAQLIADLRADFHAFDVDGDGYVTIDEFAQVLRSKNIMTEDEIRMSVQRMIEDADMDGDNKIDLEEFCAIMVRHLTITVSAQRQARASCCKCANCTCGPSCRCSKENGPGCGPCEEFMRAKRDSSSSVPSRRMQREGKIKRAMESSLVAHRSRGLEKSPAISVRTLDNDDNDAAIEPHALRRYVPNKVPSPRSRRERVHQQTYDPPTPSYRWRQTPLPKSLSLKEQADAHQEMKNGMKILDELYNKNAFDDLETLIRQSVHFFYVVKFTRRRDEIRQACDVMRKFRELLVRPGIDFAAFDAWLDHFELSFGDSK